MNEDKQQFLTFTADEEDFALSVKQVREVLEYRAMTKIPKMPEFMRGVINLRDKVIPIIDLNQKFHSRFTEEKATACIIVCELQVEETLFVMGFLTDSVQEVIYLSEEDIEPPPPVGSKVDSSFIRGLGKKDGGFLIVLNLEKVFTADEIKAARDAQGETE